MKPTRINVLLKNIFLGVFAILMILSFDSCTRKQKFLNSSIAPAARGYAMVKKDKNENFVVRVELTELAEVERLQPPRKSYIVWMLSDEGTTKNLGRLNSSTGTFSKKLKASFITVSTFKPLKVFITAENDETIQYPVGQVVLTTDRF